jgi:hypothetical protein
MRIVHHRWTHDDAARCVSGEGDDVVVLAAFYPRTIVLGLSFEV